MLDGRSSSATKVSVDSYRDDVLYPRIVRAVEPLLARGKVVAPVDVLVGMGLLDPAKLEDWRLGRVPYLEKVIDCNLIYYFQEFARGATIFMYHNDRCTVGIAAHQAVRKGRPRVAADAGEGPPPPRTKAQRGKKLLLGLRAGPALRT